MQSQGNTNEKLKNAIIYFVSKDKTVKLTKLMKLLYYLDFRCYKETGFSVTGQEYIAWPMGPVPVDVWKEIHCEEDNKRDLKKIIQLRKVPESQDSLGYDLKLIGNAKFSDKPFTGKEIKMLKEISEIFKNIPAKLMIDSTHMPGEPWEETKKTKGKNAVIDYNLALKGCSAEYIEKVQEEQEDRKFLEQFFGVAL